MRAGQTLSTELHTSSGPRTHNITDHLVNNRSLKGELTPRRQAQEPIVWVQVRLLSEPSVSFFFLIYEMGQHLLHRSATVKGIWLFLRKIEKVIDSYFILNLASPPLKQPAPPPRGPRALRK